MRPMKRLLQSLLIVMSLFLVLSKPATAEPQKLPKLGFGAAMGWEDGDLGGLNASGPALQLRLMQVWATYPVLAIGVEGEYGRLNLDAESQVGADSYGVGLVVATMIPLDLFGIEVADAPRGFGFPVYFGYNPVERLSFIEDGLGNIDGQSIRFGFQLPTPWFNGQVEYSTSFFGDSEKLPASLGGGDAERDSFAFTIQFPVVLSWHD